MACFVVVGVSRLGDTGRHSSLWSLAASLGRASRTTVIVFGIRWTSMDGTITCSTGGGLESHVVVVVQGAHMLKSRLYVPSCSHSKSTGFVGTHGPSHDSVFCQQRQSEAKQCLASALVDIDSPLSQGDSGRHDGFLVMHGVFDLCPCRVGLVVVVVIG